MKLADNEKIVAEYYFNNLSSKGHTDASNKSILTTKRLIVLYNNTEENYPLSKITAVKIKQHYNPLLFIIGFALLVLLFGSIAFGGGGGLGGAEFLIILIPPMVLIVLGLKKRTSLIISQMGGEKKYLVKNKKGDNLADFIDGVNHSLT